MSALSLDRVRRRFAASIYGNVLTLGAVVSPLSPVQTRWSAVAVVLTTCATTFVAHVAAHIAGGRIGMPLDQPQREHLVQELRDASPILVSGVGPAAILAVGAAGLVDGLAPLVVAAFLVVCRLAVSGMYVRHQRGRATPWGVVWSGLVLAGLAVVVVGVKIAVTH